MYRYDQELYYRAIWYVRKSLDYGNLTFQPESRSYPTIPRQDEEYKLPNLSSSNDWLAFVTLLICINETNDFAIAKVLAHVNRLAQRNKYEGSWGIWNKLIEEFDIGKDCQFFEKECTMFSLPDYFDFLSKYFHTDEIFGNILRRSIQLHGLVKVRKINYSVVTDKRPVKYPQRHRGYRDKGSTAPVGSREFREANRLPDCPKYPKEDFLGEVAVWGASPRELD